MSDRIALMRQGRIEQLGSPREMYDRPRTQYVADFIGETNLLPASVLTESAGVTTARIAGSTVRAPSSADVTRRPGDEAWLSVRPEARRWWPKRM